MVERRSLVHLTIWSGRGQIPFSSINFSVFLIWVSAFWRQNPLFLMLFRDVSFLGPDLIFNVHCSSSIVFRRKHDLVVCLSQCFVPFQSHVLIFTYKIYEKLIGKRMKISSVFDKLFQFKEINNFLFVNLSFSCPWLGG